MKNSYVSAHENPYLYTRAGESNRTESETAVRSTGTEVSRKNFHRRGKRIVKMDTAWKRACEKAGCPERLFHDLRRTAVRNLERAGVPRSVAMQITGHKTESVYRRYAIVSERDVAEGLERLGAFLIGR